MYSSYCIIKSVVQNNLPVCQSISTTFRSRIGACNWIGLIPFLCDITDPDFDNQAGFRVNTIITKRIHTYRSAWNYEANRLSLDTSPTPSLAWQKKDSNFRIPPFCPHSRKPLIAPLHSQGNFVFPELGDYLLLIVLRQEHCYWVQINYIRIIVSQPTSYISIPVPFYI